MAPDVSKDADAIIRRTVREAREWLDWTPGSVQRRSATRRFPISDAQWIRFEQGEAVLSDKIARSIAAVFSLPEPASWTAERLHNLDRVAFLILVLESTAQELGLDVQVRGRKNRA